MKASVLAVVIVAACSKAIPVERPPEPPAPVPPTVAPQQAVALVSMDSTLLIRDVSVLAHDSMEGRAPETPGSIKARMFLDQRFRDTGLQPFGAMFLQPFAFGSPAKTGVNIVGQLRGTALPERYIIVTAHYDHVGIRNGQIFNGADDNASGIGGMLAIADHFMKNRPRHSMIFVAFDAEESGLQGARAFLAKPPVPKDAMILNINMDMISRNDAGELYVAGTHSYPQLLPFVEQVIAVAEVKLIAGHDRPGVGPNYDWTTQSDHGAFHAAGIPFLYFGVEDHADYHRPTDDFERIQPGFYTRAVRTIIAATRLLDAGLQ